MVSPISLLKNTQKRQNRFHLYLQQISKSQTSQSLHNMMLPRGEKCSKGGGSDTGRSPAPLWLLRLGLKDVSEVRKIEEDVRTSLNLC